MLQIMLLLLVPRLRPTNYVLPFLVDSKMETNQIPKYFVMTNWNH